ncbi:hypothetical protein NDU88_009571 [Pleurodeles waltl]|uniref:Secreted protein n=1 Tax=Pleurodeles waltl TaxID=8319 RepID=A0AAV7PSG1_PLEWA|nr:hypothetical protein NDU88_009571 [Pleurodeles waltl]
MCLVCLALLVLLGLRAGGGSTVLDDSLPLSHLQPRQNRGEQPPLSRLSPLPPAALALTLLLRWPWRCGFGASGFRATDGASAFRTDGRTC